MSYLPRVAGQVSSMRANEDLEIKLSQQISNLGSCYRKSTFLDLLRQFSGNERAGWDTKTRLQILNLEELSEGKIDRAILKSECGPLLLAIKENNLEAIKDILENDTGVSLRESLRGPVDLH